MGATGRAAAFTLLSPNTPARWHEADTGATVYLDTQSGGHPQIDGGGLTQLSRAAGMWGTAGSLPLRAGDPRGPRCFNNSEPSDGRISMTYGDPCGEIADESWTLAIGGAYYSSSDVRSVNGVSYWKIVKGMIVTDNAPWKYSGMSTGCYEELVAHELGHAIGFGHAGERPALMYPAITADCGSRSRSIPLSSDDLAGMAALYPRDVAPDPPPGTPTGLRDPHGYHRHHLLDPSERRHDAQGYLLYAGTAPGLSNVGTASTNNTGLVVPNVPDGIYYIRVVSVIPPAPVRRRPTPSSTSGSPRPRRRRTRWRRRPRWQRAIPVGGVHRRRADRVRVLAGYAPGAPTSSSRRQHRARRPGVPPATYYVRIVAVNGAGFSAVSTELTMVVPSRHPPAARRRHLRPARGCHERHRREPAVGRDALVVPCRPRARRRRSSPLIGSPTPAARPSVQCARYTATLRVHLRLEALTPCFV